MVVPTISRTDLESNYDTYLFDADGVLWTGETPVPGSYQWITKLLADKSKRVYVLTNNSTKTLDQYMQKVKRLGFEGIARENIITPAIVLSEYLKFNSETFAGGTVYLIGTESLKETLEKEGGVKVFGIGPDSITQYSNGDFIHNIDIAVQPKAVICSYDGHFSYPKIMKAANFLKNPNTEYLVTNQDFTFPGPIPGLVIPGSGVTSVAVTAVCGRQPTVFGKPHKPMADFLLRRANIDAKRTVMFGDRLDTDIAFANLNGFTSVWMDTGVNSLEDIEEVRRKGITQQIPMFAHNFLAEQLRE